MHKSDLEYRFSPVALEGNTLEGTVMRYGEVSRDLPRPERFIPGAFSFQDVILNVQHDRARPIARTPETLILTDTTTALSMRAEVPETREGQDAIIQVRNRILRGLSVEFRAIREKTIGGIRVIEKAVLSGIGLVDKPAYSGSAVEARAIEGVGLSFEVPYSRVVQCECCPDASQVEFERDAFAEALTRDEIIAVAGNYQAAIASKRRGTLRVTDTREGLNVQSQIANTQAGRDLLEQAGDVGIIGRPVLDFAKSDYEVIDGVAIVRNAWIRAFLLGATDAAEGWRPVRVNREENRRRHIWL